MTLLFKCVKIIYLFQKSRRRPWTSIGQPLVSPQIYSSGDKNHFKRTGWVPCSFLSYFLVRSLSKEPQRAMILEALRFERGTTGREMPTLPLCYSALPSHFCPFMLNFGWPLAAARNPMLSFYELLPTPEVWSSTWQKIGFWQRRRKKCFQNETWNFLNGKLFWHFLKKRNRQPIFQF